MTDIEPLLPLDRTFDALYGLEVIESNDELVRAQVKVRDEIVAGGDDLAIVDEVIRMVDHSEYKRRQAPPGIKITPRAFGRDRRMPITNLYRG